MADADARGRDSNAIAVADAEANSGGTALAFADAFALGCTAISIADADADRGGFAIADDNLIGEVGEGHTHIIAKIGDTWAQVTRGAQDHDHPLPEDPATGVLLPDYYMLFVVCSNADAVLINNHPGCFPIVQADITQLDDGLQIGDLDPTPWDAGELATWETRCLSVLGFQLPAEINSGKLLVATFLGALLSRRMDEVGLRYTLEMSL